MANADHSLYVRKNEHGIVIICIYVDDLIVGGDNEAEIAHVKTLMKQEFDMKDLGELRYFLGIEIVRTKEGIWLSHKDNMHWICYPNMVWLIVSLFPCL